MKLKPFELDYTLPLRVVARSPFLKSHMEPPSGWEKCRPVLTESLVVKHGEVIARLLLSENSGYEYKSGYGTPMIVSGTRKEKKKQDERYERIYYIHCILVREAGDKNQY